MKRILLTTAALLALGACGKAGQHVDRCEQYLNDEGRWVYASPGCPMIGGGKSILITVPRSAAPDSPPVEPQPEPEPEPEKPVEPPQPEEPVEPQPEKPVEPPQPPKDHKPGKVKP